MRVAVPQTLVTLALRTHPDDGTPSFAVDVTSLRACLEDFANTLPLQQLAVDKVNERVDNVEMAVKRQGSATEAIRDEMQQSMENMVPKEFWSDSPTIGNDPASIMNAFQTKKSAGAESAAENPPVVEMDEEVEKAAIKIQAAFRGKKTRRTHTQKKLDAESQFSSGHARQIIRQIVQGELKERFVDVDILELDILVKRTVRAMEGLQKDDEKEHAEWAKMKEEFKVATEERQALRKLLSNVDVGALATDVNGLVKRLSQLELAHQQDLDALRALADRCSLLDANEAEMRRREAEMQAHLDSAVGRMQDMTSMDSLKHDINSLKKQLSDHSARLGSIEGKHTDMHGMFEKHKTEAADLKMRMQKSLQAMEQAKAEAERLKKRLEERLELMSKKLADEVFNKTAELRKWLEDVFRSHEANVRAKAERTEVEFANDALHKLQRQQLGEENLLRQLERELVQMQSHVSTLFGMLERGEVDKGKTALLGTRPLRKCLSCQQVVRGTSDLDSVNLKEENAKERLLAEVKTALRDNSFYAETQGLLIKLPQSMSNRGQKDPPGRSPNATGVPGSRPGSANSTLRTVLLEEDGKLENLRPSPREGYTPSDKPLSPLRSPPGSERTPGQGTLSTPVRVPTGKLEQEKTSASQAKSPDDELNPLHEPKNRMVPNSQPGSAQHPVNAVPNVQPGGLRRPLSASRIGRQQQSQSPAQQQLAPIDSSEVLRGIQLSKPK